jgi:hypothetical protein
MQGTGKNLQRTGGVRVQSKGKQSRIHCDACRAEGDVLSRDGKIAKKGIRRRRSGVENAKLSWTRVKNSPMHKNTATTVKTFLDESIGGRKMF